MATELVEPPPPAPPLCDEELQGLKTRLCQAVLSFQSAMHSTETGSLAQVRITCQAYPDKHNRPSGVHAQL